MNLAIAIPLRRFLAALALLLMLPCSIALAQADLSSPGLKPPTDEDAPYNDAAFVSQSVPQTMFVGNVYEVSVRLRNTGNKAWSPGSFYSLGSRNPHDNLLWGLNRSQVQSNVNPRGQVTFTFRVTAPATPRTYNFQWQMLQEYVEWFGEETPNVAVTVVPAPTQNDAAVVSQSVLARMDDGQTYTVSVTMKNTGNTTWRAAEGYALGSQNPADNYAWGVVRVSPGSDIVPGQEYTFQFNVIAPAAGSYNMQWRMLKEYVEWFGGTSNAPVTVNPTSPLPAISVQRNPAPMVADQPYTLAWSATKASELTRVCAAGGTGFKVNETLPLNGSSSGTASRDWMGYPSTCTWTATGPAGTATFTETMTTIGPGVEEVTYIHTDGLGSPVARTNAGGQLVSRTRFEPYGGVLSGAVSTLGFTGHVHDNDTGLVYMQQRYYDPAAGRFLSIDPVTTDANTGGSFNRYVYANNSPYKYVDPDGRDPDLPSFFTLSTVEGLRRDTTLGQATQRGELARSVTMPAIAIAASPSAIGVVGTGAVATPAVAGEVAGAVVETVGTRKAGLAALTLVGALGKAVIQGPKPASLPQQSVAAAMRTLKEIAKESKVVKAEKGAPPPPPPPPPKINLQ